MSLVAAVLIGLAVIRFVCPRRRRLPPPVVVTVIIEVAAR